MPFLRVTAWLEVVVSCCVQRAIPSFVMYLHVEGVRKTGLLHAWEPSAVSLTLSVAFASVPQIVAAQGEKAADDGCQEVERFSPDAAP